MLTSVASFAVVDVTAKYVVVALPLLQAIFLRQALVVACSVPLIRHAGGWTALATRRPLEHLIRAASGFAAMLMFFSALQMIPLATCIAIGQASPLIMTALSVPLLGERVGKWRWSAIALGFLGVLVIVRPGGEGAVDVGALLALGSAVLFALTMIMVRRMSNTENDVSLSFWTNLLSLIGAAVVAPFVWQPPDLPVLAAIVLMAAGLMAAQFCQVRAFRNAPVSLIAPFQYIEIALAAAAGWVIWHEAVESHVWAGAALIVASGLIVIWRERVRARGAA